MTFTNKQNGTADQEIKRNKTPHHKESPGKSFRKSVVIPDAISDQPIVSIKRAITERAVRVL